MYKQILNNLIPADDLHWCEEENKYVSLSREDIDQIAAMCLNQGINKLDDIMKVIEWAGVVRIGEILWRNFLSGGIRVVGFDEHGEPKFGPRQEEVNDA